MRVDKGLHVIIIMDFFAYVDFDSFQEKLGNWCFKPSEPQRIISGLRDTFTKRYIVERTSTVEIRPGEQSEKAESC